MPRRLARRAAASARRVQRVAWPEPVPSARRAVRLDVAAQPRVGFARQAAQRWAQHWEFVQRAAARPDDRGPRAAVPVRTAAQCEALCLPQVAAVQRQAVASRDGPQAAAEPRAEPFAVAVAQRAVPRPAAVAAQVERPAVAAVAVRVELQAAVPRQAAEVRVEPRAAAVAEPEGPAARRAAGPEALPVAEEWARAPWPAALQEPQALSAVRSPAFSSGQSPSFGRFPARSFARASSSRRASPFPVRARHSQSRRSPEATRHRTEPCRPSGADKMLSSVLSCWGNASPEQVETVGFRGEC